jgi:hypothetical protein
VKAEITIEYEDANMAKAIADAVYPDNYRTPTGLSAETRAEKTKVITKIECNESFPTFVATIDDLLSSVATAEKTLQETLKLCRRKGHVSNGQQCMRKNHCSQSF